MKFARLLSVFLLALSAIAAHALEFAERPTGFVNDLASMMSQADATTLNAKLDKFQEDKHVSIVVVTITSAADYGYPTGLIDLSVGLFDKWRPGKASTDSGILMVIAGKTPPYKIRITTGRGAEGPVPDLIAKKIIEEVMKPAMHKSEAGAYAAGITLGVEALMGRMKHEFATPPARGEERDLSFAIPLGVAMIGFVLLVVFLYRRNENLKRAVEAARLEREARERLRQLRENEYFATTSRPSAAYRERPVPSPSHVGRNATRGVAGAAAVAATYRRNTPSPAPAPTRRRDDDDYAPTWSSASTSSPSPEPSPSPSVDSGGSTSGGGAGDN